MSNPNNLHSSNEDINNPCTYIRSKARVFFVRHGDTWVRDFIPQSNGAILKHIGKRQMQAVWKYLKIAGVRGINNSIEFWEDTTRVVESVNIIIDQLIQGDSIKRNPTDMLRTTKKWQEDEERLMENGEVFIATVKLMKQIRERVNNPLENNTEFILVWHKSNKSWIEEATDNINESIDISFEIENGEIIERDIDADTGKYIDPKKHPETLFLNRSNYKIILKTLEDIPELKSAIQTFRNNTKTESERYPIWRLQNDVNSIFHSNPTPFSTYLAQTSPISLRAFSLANLIRLKDYNTIEKYYLIDCKTLSDEEKELFLKEANNEEVQNIVRKLFVCKSGLWVDSDQVVIEKYLGKDDYESFRIDRKTFQGILDSSGNRVWDIFQNSFDTLISNPELRETQKFISRWLHKFRRKPESELEKLRKEKWSISKEEEYNKIAVNLSNILHASDGRPFVLLGHVGDGKSTELARMKSEIDTNPEYQDFIPLFYSAKSNGTNSIEKIQGDINFLGRILWNPKIVIFFDGIDELDGWVRSNVVAYLNGINDTIQGDVQKIRVVIGSRPSGFDVYSDDKNIVIHFDTIDETDKKKFLISRLRNLNVQEEDIEKKLQEIEDFLARNILGEDLKNTPLILFFLCQISVNEGQLSDIRNRADLYNEIIRKIFNEHQSGKKMEWSRAQYRSLMDTLSFCAFQKYNHRTLSREEVTQYLDGAIREYTENPEEKDILDAMVDQIFLLYKVEGGETQFIIKSFEEYFLAKYLSEWKNPISENSRITQGEQVIYGRRDSNFSTWNEWRNFRPVVMFYGEMLANSGDFDALERFLWDEWLLKNDDIFGENFFMGLEMLYKLPESTKANEKIRGIIERYEGEVGKWDIAEIVKKFESIKRLAKNIGYVDNWFCTAIATKLWENTNKNSNIWSWRGDSTDILIEGALMIAEIWTPEAMREIFWLTDFLIEVGDYKDIPDIYTKIVGYWKRDAWKRMEKWIKVLLKDQHRIDIWQICQSIIETWSSEMLMEVVKLAEYLLSIDDFSRACTLYEEIAKIKTPEVAQEAAKWAKILLDNWKEPWISKDDIYSLVCNIYIELVKTGTPEAIQEALKWVEILFDAESSYYAERIYSEIARRWTPEALKEARKWIKILLDKEDLYGVWQIYCAFIETGIPEVIQEALRWVETLIQDSPPKSISYFYELVAMIGTPEAMQEALKWIETLIYEKGFLDVSSIYCEIAKIGTSEAIREVLKWIKILSDYLRKAWEYDEDDISRIICSAYDWIECSWTPEIIQEAIQWNEFLIKNSVFFKIQMNERINTVWLQETIRESVQEAMYDAVAWDINVSILWHDPLDRTNKIYRAVASIGSHEAIAEATKGAKILIDNHYYSKACSVYQEIAKTGSLEAIQVARDGAKILIDKWCCSEVYSVYQEIAKTGKPEAIQVVRDGAKILINIGELPIACLTYLTIAELWNSEDLEATITCIETLISMTLSHKGDFSLMEYNSRFDFSFLKMVDERFHFIWRLYRMIMTFGTPEAIQWALKWATMLIATGHFEEAREIFQELDKLSIRI